MNEEKIENLESVIRIGRKYCQRSDRLAHRYVIQHIKPACSEVLEDIQIRHRLCEDTKNVIHYTSIDVLVSMLQKPSEDDGKEAELRTYDSVHLNDPDEGRYLDCNIDWMKQYDWLSKSLPRSHAYITSFIIPDSKNAEREMSDNLVFWRTYGKEGEGCSLSLRIPMCRLGKVLYGADEAKCTGCILRPVVDLLDSLINNIQSQFIKDELANIVWSFLERIRYLYKSEAYDYERECRLVIPESEADTDRICFEYQIHNHLPSIRHYYKDKALKLSCIFGSGSSITLGPCVPSFKNMRHCLNMLINKEKMDPYIKKSKTSYRNS